MKNIAIKLSLVFAVSCLSGLTHADLRRFAYTYSWFTASRGEREIELTFTHIDRQSWESENEFEYGVTDRYTIAPYIVLAKDSDRTLGGFQVENRYRLGEYSEKRILPAIYLEINKMAGEPVELEGRLIGTYDPPGNFFYSANLIATRSMTRGEPVHWGYSAGATCIQGKYWLGAEGFGDFFDREHWLGPAGGIELSETSRLLGTFGFGLNGQPNQAKILLAFEF